MLDDARSSVLIRVQNEAGEEKADFEVVRAWPCKYDPSDLNATGNESVVDTLELEQDGAGVRSLTCSWTTDVARVMAPIWNSRMREKRILRFS